MFLYRLLELLGLTPRIINIIKDFIKVFFFLIYFNYKNTLYINLNINKAFKFKVIIYYIKE